MSEIKFGTDGWRAIISDDFTFANVEIVAQAVADFVNSKKSDPVYRKKKLAIGYDTRFLSDKYARRMASIFAANGISVVLSDMPCPTPALSYYVKKNRLTGGIMITASHNPPEYNGIKYKGYFGGSAGNDIIGEIEKRLNKSTVRIIPFEEAVKSRKVVTVDIIKPQLAFIKKYADMKKLRKAHLRVLVDSMNGTGLRHLETLLKGTRIRLDYIHSDINPGFNGRAPEPNERHLAELKTLVKKGKYDLGIATDGDADRVAVVDNSGEVLTGHKVMALLLLHLLMNRKMRGGVVQTICGTGLITKICKEYNIRAYETPVGFKYIAEIMMTKDVLLGGEETGGIGFKNYIPERDGFLSALLIMEMVVAMKKPLTDILKWVDKKYGSYVYEREDIVFPGAKRAKLVQGIKKSHLAKVLDRRVVDINEADGTKYICDDGSWLLLRLSGTEPKLRIYSETSSKKKSLEYIKFGKKYAFSLM